MSKTRTDGLDYVLSDEFQGQLPQLTAAWDKEWIRYLSLHDNYHFYFYDMDTSNYALKLSPSSISKLSRREMFSTEFCTNINGGVWADGKDMVDQDIFELGCGPGLFGRISSRFARSYTGVDASPFALYLARLTSPDTCSYIHWSETEKLTALRNSFDFSFGRNFFIHHNAEDSIRLLRFLRDVTKKKGMILADFFSDESSLDGHRRLDASSTLVKEYPSALFNFSDEAIREVSNAAELVCEEIEYVPSKKCRFARLRV